MHMKASTLKMAVGGALVVLACVSFGLSYADFGRGSLAIALAIAAGKAALVGVFFMEIGRESASFKLALLAAVLLVATMLGLVAADVETRGTPPLPPAVARMSR